MAIRRIQTNFNNINLSQFQISEEATDEAVNGASIFPLKNTQDIKALDPLLYEEDGYYDEADEADLALCENNELIDINEEQLIIKQLEAQIEKLESEYAANQEGKGVAGTIGGFFSSCWNGIKGDGFKDSDRVELDKKIALLQAAKADLTKLNEAYKAITGEELTDEVKQNAVASQNIADSLTSEDKQQIVDILKVQADSLAQMMQQARDDQGWFSSCMGGINNFLGFGTNSIKANAKIEEYIEQINSLDPNDPDFAAKYQALTGEALSLEGLNELAQGFSKVSNSSAAEAIMDYEETQAAAKEIGAGIVTGLAVAACVIAAPVTGGASLALGAAVGGATTVLINGTDTIGTSKTYSLEQGILDFAGGAIDGAVTALTLGGANLAGKGFSVLRGMGGAAAKEGARQVVSGGFKNALKTTFSTFGKAALRSAGIATFSSTANYLLDTVGKDIVYNDLWDNYTKADTPSSIVQNEDGTYSIYYALSDSKTGDLISYEIETFDTLSQDEEGNLVKGNILDVSQTNDFDFGDLAKQTVISAGSAVIGTGIGKITGNIINPYATSFTNSVVLGNAIEIAADMTLSLGADYLIASAQAGEFVDGSEFLSWDRVLNEGRNQIRGLLIGIASSKANPTDTITQDAIRSGLDGKTPIEAEGVPIEDRGVESDLSIKLDGEEVPLGQQRVLEDAVKLATNGDNPQNAVNLLVVNGASEVQAKEFIDEVVRLASDETIGLVFDPETGELSQAGVETKVEIQELDHPVAGDNVGVGLSANAKAETNAHEVGFRGPVNVAEKYTLPQILEACNALQQYYDTNNVENPMQFVDRYFELKSKDLVEGIKNQKNIKMIDADDLTWNTFVKSLEAEMQYVGKMNAAEARCIKLCEEFPNLQDEIYNWGVNEKVQKTLLNESNYSILVEKLNKGYSLDEAILYCVYDSNIADAFVSVRKTMSIEELTSLRETGEIITNENVQKTFLKEVDDKLAALRKMEMTKSEPDSIASLLADNGINKNANGEYDFEIPQAYLDAIKSKYEDKYLIENMIKTLQTPLQDADIKNLEILYKLIDDEYKQKWQNNVCDMILTYKKLKNAGLFGESLLDESQAIAPIFTLSTNGLKQTIKSSEIKLDNVQMKSLNEYKGPGYSRINSKCSSQDCANNADISTLTTLLKQQATTEQIEVYRGESTSSLEQIILSDGETLAQKIKAISQEEPLDVIKINMLIEEVKNGKFKVTQDRFLSTSTHKDTSYYQNAEPIVKWDLNLPIGTQALILDGTDYGIQGSVFGIESECLIQRGSVTEIKDIYFDFEKRTWHIAGDLKTLNETHTPKMTFNPETGELSAVKPQSEAENVNLDHPVAGDNVGVKLDLSSSTQKKPIEFSEEERAYFAENREHSRLYKAYIDRYDTLPEESRVAIEKVLNHVKNVNQSNLNGRTLNLLSAEGETIDCHINMYSTSTLGVNYRSEVIEILDAQGDVVGKINYEFGDNTGYMHIQNMMNNTDGAVSHVGSELHNLLQSRCQELGIEKISLDSVDSAVVFHYKNGFRTENPEVNAKIEELIANSDGKRITFDGVKMFLKVPEITSLDADFSSVDYKNLTPEQKTQADDCAIKLATKYQDTIQVIRDYFNGIFGDKNTVSARAKSPKSILEKLIAKQQKGDLTEFTFQKAAEMIGDGYGIRRQIPSLTQTQTDSIIQDCLAGTGKTQAQFQKLIDDGKFDELLADDDFRTTYESLKEARSQGDVDILVAEIREKRIVPANGKDDYFNNYGSEITSYFTNKQLLQIDEAYYQTYGKHLTFVNKTPVEIPNGKLDMFPEELATNVDKAEKPSGYSGPQFNITTNHTDKNNPLPDMELQLRGVEVHKVAENEHIPYDVRQGKITATNQKYSQYYTPLKGMSAESYADYSKYLKATYTWAVLKELNLTTDAQKPKLEVELFYGDIEYLQEVGIDTSLAGRKLTPEEMEKITIEGLAKYKVK